MQDDDYQDGNSYAHIFSNGASSDDDASSDIDTLFPEVKKNKIRKFFRIHWKALAGILFVLAAVIAAGLTVFFAPVAAAACSAVIVAIAGVSLSTALVALCAAAATAAVTVFAVLLAELVYQVVNAYSKLHNIFANPTYYGVSILVALAVGGLVAVTLFSVPSILVGIGITFAAAPISIGAIAMAAVAAITILPAFAYLVINALDRKINPDCKSPIKRDYSDDPVVQSRATSTKEAQQEPGFFEGLFCCSRSRREAEAKEKCNHRLKEESYEYVG